MDPKGKRGWEELGGVGGGETIIRIQKKKHNQDTFFEEEKKNPLFSIKENQRGIFL